MKPDFVLKSPYNYSMEAEQFETVINGKRYQFKVDRFRWDESVWLAEVVGGNPLQQVTSRNIERAILELVKIIENGK